MSVVAVKLLPQPIVIFGNISNNITLKYMISFMMRGLWQTKIFTGGKSTSSLFVS